MNKINSHSDAILNESHSDRAVSKDPQKSGCINDTIVQLENKIHDTKLSPTFNTDTTVSKKTIKNNEETNGFHKQENMKKLSHPSSIKHLEDGFHAIAKLLLNFFGDGKGGGARQLQQIENRLDEITKTIASFSNLSGNNENHIAVLERIEAQIENVAKSVENNSYLELSKKLEKKILDMDTRILKLDETHTHASNLNDNRLSSPDNGENNEISNLFLKKIDKIISVQHKIFNKINNDLNVSDIEQKNVLESKRVAVNESNNEVINFKLANKDRTAKINRGVNKTDVHKPLEHHKQKEQQKHDFLKNGQTTPSFDPDNLSTQTTNNTCLHKPETEKPDLASIVKQVNKKRSTRHLAKKSNGSDLVVALRKKQILKNGEFNKEAQEKTKKSLTEILKEKYDIDGKSFIFGITAVISLVTLIWFCTTVINGFVNKNKEGTNLSSNLEPVTSLDSSINLPKTTISQLDNTNQNISKLLDLKLLKHNPDTDITINGTDIKKDTESLPEFVYEPAYLKNSNTYFFEKKSIDNSNKTENKDTFLPSEIGPDALRKAAKNGNPIAQFEIARRYTIGDGVDPDFKIALQWYILAARQNIPAAQYFLGNFYEKGQGTKRNVEAAKMWYHHAAKQGNILAMHNLAVIYASGISDQKPNMKKASQWFLKAAQFGVQDSKINIAILYTQGIGLPRNLQEAYKWFALAADNDIEAAYKRDTVGKVLGAEELANAKLMVKSWKPKKIKSSANIVIIPEEWKSRQSKTIYNKNMKLSNLSSGL